MRLAPRSAFVAVAALVVFAQPHPVARAGESAAPSPAASNGPAIVLWLRGPFGTVASEPGATPAPDDRPLDAFVRSAPLRLETGDPDATIGEWRASFIDLDGGRAPIEATGTADGGTPSSGVTVTAPDIPGRYRLEASAQLDPDGPAVAAWTIVVPDRALPPDGLIDVPAPDLLLSAGDETVAGWPGSGCHIYLCVDVGRLPPLRMVPSIDATPGDTMRLRLSDDSGIAAWKVTLYPILSGIQPALDAVGEEPVEPLDGFDIPAPAAGDWLMQVEVTYDRLRGWTHAFYRVASGASSDPAASGGVVARSGP